VRNEDLIKKGLDEDGERKKVKGGRLKSKKDSFVVHCSRFIVHRWCMA
jgi:hypothetical protein